MKTSYLLGALVVLIVAAAGIAAFTGALNGTPGTGQVACTMEAKICPDGSAVGRSGPNCEFTACPTVLTTQTPPTSATLQASIGESATAVGITITPLAVQDDSRCPTGVQCIWAGTVHVRATVASALGTSEIVFELGKSVTTDTETITLTSVLPAKDSGSAITPADYRFSFDVSKR